MFLPVCICLSVHALEDLRVPRQHRLLGKLSLWQSQSPVSLKHHKHPSIYNVDPHVLKPCHYLTLPVLIDPEIQREFVVEF